MDVEKNTSIDLDRSRFYLYGYNDDGEESYDLIPNTGNDQAALKTEARKSSALSLPGIKRACTVIL